MNLGSCSTGGAGFGEKEVALGGGEEEEEGAADDEEAGTILWGRCCPSPCGDAAEDGCWVNG